LLIKKTKKSGKQDTLTICTTNNKEDTLTTINVMVFTIVIGNALKKSNTL